jgi:hypothetical protein
MNTTLLASLTLPTTITIVYAPAPMGKVATMLSEAEAISLVNRALNAWYYG